jgi:large subunit ribosomal protein L9
MQVLLRQNVEKLGKIGDIVNVAPGYARNYLLPRKLALEVTKANVESLQRAKEARLKREREEVERLKEVCARLEGFLCVVEARATETGHLFGSVGPEQVAQALVQSGFESIRQSNVVLPQHIEQVGDYDVEIMLHPEVRANIKLRVAPPADQK